MNEEKKLDRRKIATEVVQTLQASGHEAYFAGGCVRDQIMGNVPEDYDIATSARPEDVVRLFPRSMRVGAAFGVVMVRRHGYCIEVATFRSDGVYSDGRRPDSITYTTAEHDAQRRDFTCNGLFFDPVKDKLIDYVGGQADIEAKVLRAIGQPLHRFREDHLRMMRAVRFAARLQFSIEPGTWAAIVANAAKLSEISRERIGQELRKMLVHPQRHLAVHLLINSGLFNTFWSKHIEPTIAAINLPKISALPEKSSFPLALAAILLDLAAVDEENAAALVIESNTLQENLALSTEETQWTQWLLNNLPYLAQWRTLRLAAFRRLLAHSWSSDLITLYTAANSDRADMQALTQHISELKQKPLTPDRFVNGSDLIAMGVKPGPRFKFWLEELYDRQLEDNFADRTAALKAAEELIHGS